MFWSSNSNTKAGMKKKLSKLERKIDKMTIVGDELVRMQAIADMWEIYELGCDVKDGKRPKEEVRQELINRIARSRKAKVVREITSRELDMKMYYYSILRNWIESI